MSKKSNEKVIKYSPYKRHILNTGSRLLLLRGEAGLSQQQLVDDLTIERKDGAFVNISKSQYVRIECGKSVMNTETLMALCKYYGVSADYIIFGEKEHEDSITNYLSKSNAISFCNLLEYLIKKIKDSFNID